jgi:hypothetical protein
MNPYDRTPYSNLFNNIRFTPLPWASLAIDSQVPAFDKGFTEIDTTISFQPMANLQLNLGTATSITIHFSLTAASLLSADITGLTTTGE